MPRSWLIFDVCVSTAFERLRADRRTLRSSTTTPVGHGLSWFNRSTIDVHGSFVSAHQEQSMLRGGSRRGASGGSISLEAVRPQGGFSRYYLKLHGSKQSMRYAGSCFGSSGRERRQVSSLSLGVADGPLLRSEGCCTCWESPLSSQTGTRRGCTKFDNSLR
jgi:hypothetical protein